MTAGTYTDINKIGTALHGYSNGAITANQYLVEYVVPFQTAIGAVMVDASTAGVGAGNSIVDVQINGVSIWTTAGNRPTLASASTGQFTNKIPDKRSLQIGDIVAVKVISIPATTGHARVKATVTLNLLGK